MRGRELVVSSTSGQGQRSHTLTAYVLERGAKKRSMFWSQFFVGIIFNLQSWPATGAPQVAFVSRLQRVSGDDAPHSGVSNKRQCEEKVGNTDAGEGGECGRPLLRGCCDEGGALTESSAEGSCTPPKYAACSSSSSMKTGGS